MSKEIIEKKDSELLDDFERLCKMEFHTESFKIATHWVKEEILKRMGGKTDE